MRTHAASVPLLGVLAFAAGCATVRPTASDARASLDRAVASYDAMSATRDPDQLVRHFRDDVVVLSPQSREPAIGIAPNRAAWARFFALPKSAHTIRTRTTVMSAAGDMAYTIGEWTATFERQDGVMQPGSGEIITVWRRDPAAAGTAREWKIAAVMAHRVR